MSKAQEGESTQMSFWDHLEELRGTLIRSALVLCVLTVPALVFKNILFKIILYPCSAAFPLYRLMPFRAELNLINIDISAQFFTHLKASLCFALVVGMPLVLIELWKFIKPALYPSEKKVLTPAALLSLMLFYLGAAVGYFIVLPVCLQFFLNYSVSDSIQNTISLSSYMSMFFSMVLLIGLTFELPIIILVLNSLGVLTLPTLRKGRKIAFVLVLILAAFITPSDPFSMFVLALPLYLLYEFAILLCSLKRH